MGTNFNKLWNDPKFIDSTQKAKIDFEVALIGKLIEARESKGLSQKELAELAGLKQPAIARLESMKATISLYVKNVFDEEVYHANVRGTSPVQYRQYPREGRLKVAVKF